MAGFSDVLGHEQTILHMKHAVQMNKVSHAYIISGEKEESSYVTSLERSLESHYCALAAEYSRTHDGCPVQVAEFAK